MRHNTDGFHVYPTLPLSVKGCLFAVVCWLAAAAGIGVFPLTHYFISGDAGPALVPCGICVCAALYYASLIPKLYRDYRWGRVIHPG